jgi:hypothetical protein
MHLHGSFHAGGLMLQSCSGGHRFALLCFAATAYLVKAPFAAMSGAPWNTVAVSGCLTAGVTLAAEHTTMRGSYVQMANMHMLGGDAPHDTHDETAGR